MLQLLCKKKVDDWDNLMYLLFSLGSNSLTFVLAFPLSNVWATTYIANNSLKSGALPATTDWRRDFSGSFPLGTTSFGAKSILLQGCVLFKIGNALFITLSPLDCKAIGRRIDKKATRSFGQLIDEIFFDLWNKWLWNQVIVVKVTTGLSTSS